MPAWVKGHLSDRTGPKHGDRWTYRDGKTVMDAALMCEVAVYKRHGNDFFEVSWVGVNNPLYGPYATLEDAQTAALMLAEITDKPKDDEN